MELLDVVRRAVFKLPDLCLPHTYVMNYDKLCGPEAHSFHDTYIEWLHTLWIHHSALNRTFLKLYVNSMGNEHCLQIGVILYCTTSFKTTHTYPTSAGRMFPAS